MFTKDQLDELFHYNAETGDLMWKEHKTGRATGPIGAAAKDQSWYAQVTVGEWTGNLHRIIWCMLHGSWPTKFIDHINGNKRDNRASNLREVTRQQNLMNRAISRNNTQGVKGVYFYKRRASASSPQHLTPWAAEIGFNGKNHRMFFSTFDAALAQRRLWEDEFFGEYNRKAVN